MLINILWIAALIFVQVNSSAAATAMSAHNQRLLERIPELAWLMTDCGEITAANRRWWSYFEQSPSNMLFVDRWHKADRDFCLIAWDTARSTATPLEIKLRLQSGTSVEWFALELEPDRDEEGRVSWLGIAVPLGSEAAIPGRQQSVQFLSALLAYASEGIVACNAEGQLVLFNRMAQLFHGLPPEPLVPEEWSTYYDLYDGDGSRLLTKAEIPLFRALQGEVIIDEAMTIKAKSQPGARSLLASGAAIYSPAGEKLGAVVLMRDITAQKQAETAYQQTQLYSDRISLAMRTAQAGAWHWDLIQQKASWTPEFEALFGNKPGTMPQIYSEWLDRVHPDDRAEAESKFQAAVTQGLPEFYNEYRIIWRDGQMRWLAAVGQFHHDDQGDADAISGMVYDITARKHNEEALRSSEEFTRRILESNHDCIKVLDRAGRLLYMNDGGQRLLEIDDFATIANKPWLNFWQDSEAELAKAAFATALTGKVGKFEGFCATAKGRPKWWEVVVTPMLGADGAVDQILSVSRDVTERYEAKAVLQASEALFRQTFEQSAIGVAHVGLDGAWLRVNRKLCDIVGYRPDELLAINFQAITEPADLAEDLDLVQQLMQGEISEYSLEKRYMHKCGHRVWVCLTVALVRSPAPAGQLGAPQYFLSAVQDISERKRSEMLNQMQAVELQRLNDSLMLTQHSLNERNEDLDRFAHMVSHDLKAPLRAIANLSEWLEDDLNGQIPADNQQQLQLLRQRVSRMDNLIDGLLRYSQIGRKALETEPVDVAQLLAETINSLVLPAGFAINILSPLPTLNTKRILLSQVLANLLSNAIKHHDRVDGYVDVSVADLGDYYQFTIADDGPGIPAGAARDRIFEMFQTLNPTASTANTGIGLALVKKIVEEEGGQIWVDDAAIKGAQFCFTWRKS